MSNQAVIGYKDDQGKFRGTYVHGLGDALDRELSGVTCPELINWIEAGIEGGGYSSPVDEYPYGDDLCVFDKDEIVRSSIRNIWLVNDNGQIVRVNVSELYS